MTSTLAQPLGNYLPGSPADIRGLADQLERIGWAARRAADDVDGLARAVPASWHDSPGADAFQAVLIRQAGSIAAVAADAVTAVVTLREFADELDLWQQHARVLLDTIASLSVQVGHDNEVLLHPNAGGPFSSPRVFAFAVTDFVISGPALERAQVDLGELVLRAHHAAVAAAAVLAPLPAGLAALQSGAVLTAPSRVPGLPARSPAYQQELDAIAALSPSIPSDPIAAAAWWANLDPDLQSRIMARWPAVIGNAAGLPATIRDAANRAALAADLMVITERTAGAGHPLPSTIDLQLSDNELALMATLQASGFSDDEVRAAWSTLAVAGALQQGSGFPGRPLQLLAFDPAAFHGKGRAIVSIGDVGTASTVTTLVPGMTSNVPCYLSTELADSRSLLRQRIQDGAGSHEAVIAYLGYDAPGLDFSAARLDRAVSGAALLSADLAGIQAAERSGAQNTVVAHSYGATTACVAAAADGLHVDQLILIGSPGAGPAQSIADLHMPVGTVWVGSASKDPVTTWLQQLQGSEERNDLMVDKGWPFLLLMGPTMAAGAQIGDSLLGNFSLGRDPAQFGFGAIRFRAETVNRNPVSFANHSSYLQPGSESLRNISAIVGGDNDKVGLAALRPEPGEHDDGIDPESGRVPAH